MALSEAEELEFLELEEAEFLSQQPAAPAPLAVQPQRPSRSVRALGALAATGPLAAVAELMGGRQFFEGALPLTTRATADLPLGVVQAGLDLLPQGGVAQDISESISRVTAETTRQAEEVPGGAILRAIPQIAQVAGPLGAQRLAATGVSGLGGTALRLGEAGVRGGVEAGAIAAAQPREEVTAEERTGERIDIAQEVAPIGAAIGTGVQGVIGAVGAVGAGISRLRTGRDADEILAKRLTGQDLQAVKRTLEDGSEITVLPDIAGDEVQGLTRLVGRTTGGPKQTVSDFFKDRSFGSVKRVIRDLNKRVSNVKTYFGNLDDVAKARSEAAAPLYRTAYKQATDIKSKRLDTLLADPRLVSAIDDAKSKLGVRLEAPRNSLETLDGAKKVLDDRIGEAIRGGRNQEAAAIGELKNELLKVLDNASSAYGEARRTFAGFRSVENAQELGLTFSRRTPEQIALEVKQLSPSELDAYRIGVRANLQKVVQSTADGADPAKRVFGNSFKRDQIEAVFDNKKEFNAFSKRMNEEIDAANTKFAVLGGSRSDINIAEDGGALANAAQTAATQGLRGVKNKIADSIALGISKRWAGITDANAKQLAKILTNKKAGVAALDRLIKKTANSGQKAIMQEVKDSITVGVVQ